MLDAAPGTTGLVGVADGVASVEVDSTVVEVLVETFEEVEVAVVNEELI